LRPEGNVRYLFQTFGAQRKPAIQRSSDKIGQQQKEHTVTHKKSMRKKFITVVPHRISVSTYIVKKTNEWLVLLSSGLAGHTTDVSTSIIHLLMFDFALSS